MSRIIDTSIYSKSAILTAIKKQQAFADWSIIDQSGENVTVSFSHVRQDAMPFEKCEKLFERQLKDEQLREKLEEDFTEVRNMLVKLALSPIENS